MIFKKYFAAVFSFIIFQTSFVSTQTITVDFRVFVERNLQKSKLNLTKICPVDTDLIARRIFLEYGAIFVSRNRGMLPSKCIFENEEEVFIFQSLVKPKSAVFGGIKIELQESALKSLLKAEKEAAEKGLRITPRGGTLAAKRSFQDTVRLWYSRVNPALNYWVTKRKISPQDAEGLKKLSVKEQVAKVLEWEEKGIFFSKDFQKSILYSVAAPGASQHIFMLALDIEQFADKRVREILAKHGWFQTVKSDLPHFTFLGVKEDELPSLALRKEIIDGFNFWIPNFEK